MNADTINLDGDSGKMGRLGGGEYEELCFAHVFEMFIRQHSGNVG